MSNDGEPIPDDVAAHIFVPFFTTKTTGTGLGLAVVKAVARAHQGQLLLQSRAGRGTCAIVSLPLLDAASHSNQE